MSLNISKSPAQISNNNVILSTLQNAFNDQKTLNNNIILSALQNTFNQEKTLTNSTILSTLQNAFKKDASPTTLSNTVILSTLQNTFKEKELNNNAIILAVLQNELKNMPTKTISNTNTNTKTKQKLMTTVINHTLQTVSAVVATTAYSLISGKDPTQALLSLGIQTAIPVLIKAVKQIPQICTTSDKYNKWLNDAQNSDIYKLIVKNPVSSKITKFLNDYQIPQAFYVACSATLVQIASTDPNIVAKLASFDADTLTILATAATTTIQTSIQQAVTNVFISKINTGVENAIKNSVETGISAPANTIMQYNILRTTVLSTVSATARIISAAINYRSNPTALEQLAPELKQLGTEYLQQTAYCAMYQILNKSGGVVNSVKKYIRSGAQISARKLTEIARLEQWAAKKLADGDPKEQARFMQQCITALYGEEHTRDELNAMSDEQLIRVHGQQIRENVKREGLIDEILQKVEQRQNLTYGLLVSNMFNSIVDITADTVSYAAGQFIVDQTINTVKNIATKGTDVLVVNKQPQTSIAEANKQKIQDMFTKGEEAYKQKQAEQQAFKQQVKFYETQKVHDLFTKGEEAFRQRAAEIAKKQFEQQHAFKQQVKFYETEKTKDMFQRPYAGIIPEELQKKIDIEFTPFGRAAVRTGYQMAANSIFRNIPILGQAVDALTMYDSMATNLNTAMNLGSLVNNVAEHLFVDHKQSWFNMKWIDEQIGSVRLPTIGVQNKLDEILNLQLPDQKVNLKSEIFRILRTLPANGLNKRQFFTEVAKSLIGSDDIDNVNKLVNKWIG